MLGGKISEIYEKYGLKCVYPLIYILFFLLNFLTSLGMSYPATDPNELSIIAVAQYFAGKNWAGVMCSVDYYYGFIQGLIYSPVMFVFGSPSVQYTAILFVNAALISFVPVISFSIARHIGVDKLWKLLVISFVSGGYCCYFAHSKFAWNETITILLPWLILWLIFRNSERKNKAAKHGASIIIGLLCGISIEANVRLIGLIFAVIIFIIGERVFYGKKSIFLPSFIPALLVSVAGVMFVSHIVRTELWCRSDPAELINTIPNLMNTLSGEIENSSARFIQTFFGQLYYFVTSTWGFGALAFCLFGAIIIHCVKKKKEGTIQTYSHGIAMFSFFTFFFSLSTILSGTIYRFGTDGFYTYQDNVIFGRFIDGVIPFSLMLVLVVLFTSSIKLNKILGAAILAAIIYLVFFTIGVPVILECGSTRISPILGLYPLRIGAAGAELLNFNSLLLTVSAVFSVFSIFVVVISCTKKYRSAIISVIISGLTIYSLIFISGTYLPMCSAESVAKNEAAVDISEKVYNQNGAPALTVYNLNRHDALMLQFLNTNINVRITYDIETIPENCFVAVKADEDVSALINGRKPFLLIAENDGLRLYAYGDRAVAYMRSQNVDDTEEQNAPLITTTTTEIPVMSPITETTTAATTTTTERTSFTTERTPIISTYKPPEVVTSHADEFDNEDDWAAIE